MDKSVQNLLLALWPHVRPALVVSILQQVGITTNVNALGKHANKLGLRFIKENHQLAKDALNKAKVGELKDIALRVLDEQTVVERHERIDELKFLRKRITDLEEGSVYAKRKADLYAKLLDYSPTPLPEWISAPTHVDDGTNTVIPTLVLSDFHYPEVVRPDTIRGVNAYNAEIAEYRLKKVIENTIKLCRVYTAGVRFDGFCLLLAGDLWSGVLRPETRQANEFNIFPALMRLFDLLVAAIQALRDEFGFVVIKSVVGNHGRYDLKPQHKTYVEDNFEWLLCELLARHFADDPNVSMENSAAPEILFKLYDTAVLLTHGHQIRGGQGLTGVGNTILRNMIKIERQFETLGQEYHFDLLVMGHHHTFFHQQNVIVNSSIIGYTEFANAILARFEPPTQTLFFVDHEKGVTDVKRVFCE